MKAPAHNSDLTLIENLENRVLFSTSFLSQLTPTPTVTGSTVPANGDANPYGVAFVPAYAAGGKLVAGDVLVSNFNSATAGQGAGTTIVEINPKTGAQSLFFQGQSGLGLTTALGVLPGGFVLVGNVAQNPMNPSLPEGHGSLLIINKYGQLVKTLVDPKLLDGPWDLTVVNNGFIQTVFVSNVLNGTVSRLDFLDDPFGFGTANQLLLLDKTQVASGYQFGLNGGAFVVGPTGLAFDQLTNTLYVASTEDNAIYAVGDAEFSFPHSGTGRLVFSKGRTKSRFIRKLGPLDQRVEWFKPKQRPKWMSGKQFAALPPGLIVREVRYHLAARGQRTRVVTIVTTLLDETLYPAEKIAELYGLRWQVETHFGELKTSMKMSRLKCKTADGVKKELLMYFITYNLIRRIILEAAERQRISARQISFIDALRWLASAGETDELIVLVVIPLRPDRHEPRVKKYLKYRYRPMTRPRRIMKKRPFLYADKVK